VAVVAVVVAAVVYSVVVVVVAAAAVVGVVADPAAMAVVYSYSLVVVVGCVVRECAMMDWVGDVDVGFAAAVVAGQRTSGEVDTLAAAYLSFLYIRCCGSVVGV